MDERSKREQFRKYSPEVIVEEKLTKLQFNLAIEMRKLRTALGLTQKELAEKLGVGQPAISKLESADISNSFENVLRYLAALDADLVVAIAYEGELCQVSDRVDFQLKQIFENEDRPMTIQTYVKSNKISSNYSIHDRVHPIIEPGVLAYSANDNREVA